MREILLKNNWYSIKKKKLESLTIDTLIFYIFVNMNNIRNINYFTKKFINYWYDDWLLVNEKVILMVSLDENQEEIGHINIL